MARARRAPRDPDAPREPRTPFRQHDAFPILVLGTLLIVLVTGYKLVERHREHIMDDQALALLRVLADADGDEDRLSVGREEAPYGWFTTRPRGYVASGYLDTPGPEQITALVERAAEEVGIDVLCTTLYGAEAGRFVHDKLGRTYTNDQFPTTVCNFFQDGDAAGKIALESTPSASSILRFTYGMDFRSGFGVPGIRFRDYQALTGATW